MTRIWFSVNVPVLSEQITVVDPSVSIADSRLTSAPERASSRTPIASASVIVGSSPSGTLATISPIAKLAASVKGSPASSAEREEGESCDDGHQSDHPCDPPDFALERALLALEPLGEGGDATQLGAHARREHERAGLPLGHVRAAEDEVARLEERRMVKELGGAICRERLARQHREVDLERALEQTRVSRDPIARFEQEHVAGDELAGIDLAVMALAHHLATRRQIPLQRLHGPFRLLLLEEGEERVQDDHGDDRRREHCRDGYEREPRGDPEQ